MFEAGTHTLADVLPLAVPTSHRHPRVGLHFLRERAPSLVPALRGGDGGGEHEPRGAARMAREVDEVPRAADVGLEGGESEVEVEAPRVVDYRRNRIVNLQPGKF